MESQVQKGFARYKTINSLGLESRGVYQYGQEQGLGCGEERIVKETLEKLLELSRIVKVEPPPRRSRV